MIDWWLAKEREADRAFSYITSNNCSRDEPTNPARIKANLRVSPGPTFVGLWGGSKETKEGIADSADAAVLDYLYHSLIMAKRFLFHSMDGGKPMYLLNSQEYKVYLLFCDTHHIVANGIEPKRTEQYFESLETLLEKTDERYRNKWKRNRRVPVIPGWASGDSSIYLNLVRLSDILQDLTGLEDDDFAYANQISREKTEEIMANKEFVDLLADKARRHSLRVREKDADPVKIAKLYAQLEIFFLRKVNSYKSNRFNKADFTNAVFFSYSEPRIQRPIAEAADVPMLYFHSTGKGHHECPWYIKRD